MGSLAGGQPPPQPGLRSTGHLHAAHAVAEAVSPEAGHVVLLDFHLVALEVSRLVQGDFVVLSLLQKTEGGTLGCAGKASELAGAQLWAVPAGLPPAASPLTILMGRMDMKQSLR